MNEGHTPTVTLEDHRKAFTEISFLLDIFASTVDNIMGRATASVGRIAGREKVRKLPISLDHPSLEEALAVLNEHMKAGFEISAQKVGKETEIRFDRCTIREVCDQRHLAPGCELCVLFHSYIDGMLNELISRPVKSQIIEAGKICRTCTLVQ